MLRTKFEQDLQTLQDQIVALGSEVEGNVVKAAEALTRRDLRLSRALIVADTAVNEKRIQIGMDGLTLITRQQPMAGDMRLIAAIIEIVGELERIHDYVKGIGRISLMLGETAVLPIIVDPLMEMAQITQDMLHRALSACIDRSAEAARAIPADDDKVDALYNSVYREIINYVIKNPTEVEHANRLEWAAHNLERAADRVTNICEWVVYLVDGRYVEMDSEYDAPPTV